MISFEKGGALRILVLLGFLSQPVLVCAAEHAFDIDLKDLDQESPALSKEKAKTPKPSKNQQRDSGRVSSAKAMGKASADGYLHYTVKPGDHLFKILVNEFGMTSEKAELLIPEIVRLNDIGNIKNLKVGRTLLIPSSPQRHLAHAKQSGGRGKTDTERGGSKEVVAPIAAVAPPPAHLEPAAPAPAPVPGQTAPARNAAITASDSAVVRHEDPVRREAVVPQSSTWVCSVPEKDPRQVLDALMNVLSLRWKRNRIINSEDGAPIAYSIMVDRYFEHKGNRYIITVGDNDPYNYTLLRLLETSGYKVLRLKGGEDFEVVGAKLLSLVGVTSSFGRYAVAGGSRECSGFLIQEDDAGGRRVLVTSEAMSHQQKAVLAAGCAGS